MVKQNEWWARDVAAASGQTPQEKKAAADIVQSGASAQASQASAASSAATAEEKRAKMPYTVRKAAADAALAEANAAKAQVAIEKLRKLGTSFPPPEKLPEARELLLMEIRNLAEAKDLSKTMFGASGVGSGVTGRFAGTPAATVKGILQPVQSNAAFEKLSKMRQESPTGAALGNVTDKDLQLLITSEGLLDQSVQDTSFQRGVDDVLRKRVQFAVKLGIKPEELAGALGPQNTEQFADEIKAYRFRPEDETAIQRYVSTSKKAGTFDPTDYAALVGQAYKNATGYDIDETFINNALQAGENIASGKGEGINLDYSAADKSAREAALTKAQGAQPDGLSWGETLGGAAINLVPSTFELAADTVKALTVNLPDTLEGAAKIIAGATGLSEDETAWQAVKDYYTDRYGSIEGFKRALRSDPASFLADVAGIASGGATLLGKTLGTAAKVSRIAQLADAAKASEVFAKSASILDPLVLAGKGTKAALSTGKGAAETLGLGIPSRAAGVTTADVKQAFQAGREGSPEFVGQMEGAANAENPISKAQQALSELYQQRSADYTRRMDRLKQNPETLDFTDVDDAINNVREVGRHRGIDISSAADVWDAVDAKVAEFAQQGLNTVEDFDAMKRAIGNIRDGYQPGTPQYKVANDVAKAINATITKKAPVYAQVMGDYRAASDVLSDVTNSLSMGAASADTTLNKLRRTASGKGPRGRTVLDILESTRSGKGLGNMLAGQALSGKEAAGLTPTISTGAAFAAGSPEPLLGAMLSPQRLGRAAYGAGRVAGEAERMLGRTPIPAVSERLMQLAQRYGPDVLSGVRIANPPLIQPQVAEYDRAPAAPSEQQMRAALLSRYAPTPPQAVAIERPSISLSQLYDRYPSAASLVNQPPADVADLLKVYGGPSTAPEEEEGRY